MGDQDNFVTRMTSIDELQLANKIDACEEEKLTIATKFTEKSHQLEEIFKQEKAQRQQEFDYQIAATDSRIDQALKEAEMQLIVTMESQLRVSAELREGKCLGSGERFLNHYAHIYSGVAARLSEDSKALAEAQRHGETSGPKQSQQSEDSNNAILNKRKHSEINSQEREKSEPDDSDIVNTKNGIVPCPPTFKRLAPLKRGALVKKEAQNGNPSATAAKAEDTPITEHELKEILTVIKDALQTVAWQNFRLPVAILLPGFANRYLIEVSNPIDLGIIENKLKEKKYSSIEHFKADIQLLYDNTLFFNRGNDSLTRAAAKVQVLILTKVNNISAASTIQAKAAPAPRKNRHSSSRS